MLTNLTNIHGNAAMAARRPEQGTLATAMSVICLRSLPTYQVDGDGVQRHGQKVESLGFLNRRQNQF
jgi:hypothetical protein